MVGLSTGAASQYTGSNQNIGGAAKPRGRDAAATTTTSPHGW